MPRFVSKMGWVECPRCAKRFFPYKRRLHPDDEIKASRWKVAYKGKRGALQVGKFGFRGWLGSWRDVMRVAPNIVPPFRAIGMASMEIKAVLRKNGLWVKDLETGRWRRARRGDVVARTDEGRRRLAAFGWPGGTDGRSSA